MLGNLEKFNHSKIEALKIAGILTKADPQDSKSERLSAEINTKFKPQIVEISLVLSN